MNSTQPSRRVVITGLGVISPLGNTQEDLWRRLAGGESGVAPLSSIPAEHLPMSFAAEARQFTGSIDDFGPLEGEQKKAIRKGLKTICREAQMGIAAAQRALSDAGLGLGKCDPERIGAVFGSDYMISPPDEFVDPIQNCLDDQRCFDFSRWAVDGLAKMNPLWLLKYLPNMPAAHLAIYNDLRGPNNSLTQREASANLALGEAFRYITRGAADVMVAGATGTYVHPSKVIHAALQQELAGNGCPPERACRPFDLNRTGMVLGEGAGAVVLEELQRARARGATIYAEIIGTASASVATRGLVAQRDRALVHVMRGALRDAGIEPRDVGHVHAHGLGTRTSDAEESQAICEVFGPRDRQPPVTAAKSYFGNLGAGGGAVELIASVLALVHGQLFPVLTYETPDPACPINVATDAARSPGRSFLNVNVTCQGQASAVMVRAYG